MSHLFPPHLRLGTSSYIVPADFEPNIDYLKDKVDDIELLFFETDEYCNYPSPERIDGMAASARAYDLTYTVHLPMGLHPGSPDAAERRQTVDTIAKLVKLTQPLRPFAYVLHLETEGGEPANDIETWRHACRDSIQGLLNLGISSRDLCVETLCYPPDVFYPLLEEFDLSVTLDIGHMWLKNYPAMQIAREVLPRTRIIHLHGVADNKDHQGLSVLNPHVLDSFLQLLLQDQTCERVLTIEIFSEPDFIDSIQTLERWFHA